MGKQLIIAEKPSVANDIAKTLGGFTKLSGEEDPKATGSLASKSIPIRLLVLGAGSLMNLLLPVVLLTIALMLPHEVQIADPENGQGDVFVATITPASAQSMALQAGDELYALVKAPWVQVAAKAPRRQAGRNRLTGTLMALQPGRTHTACTLQLTGGLVLEATVPNTEAAALSLGAPAWATFATDSAVLVTFR